MPVSTEVRSPRRRSMNPRCRRRTPTVPLSSARLRKLSLLTSLHNSSRRRPIRAVQSGVGVDIERVEIDGRCLPVGPPCPDFDFSPDRTPSLFPVLIVEGDVIALPFERVMAPSTITIHAAEAAIDDSRALRRADAAIGAESQSTGSRNAPVTEVVRVLSAESTKPSHGGEAALRATPAQWACPLASADGQERGDTTGYGARYAVPRRVGGGRTGPVFGRFGDRTHDVTTVIVRSQRLFPALCAGVKRRVRVNAGKFQHPREPASVVARLLSRGNG